MFGKPEWFKKKTTGWGIHPTTFKGWIYTVAWCGLTCLPFMLMMARTHWIEACVWVVCSAALLVFDVRKIIQQMDQDASGGKLIITGVSSTVDPNG